MSQPPCYYFIDPGESTGWAKFNAEDGQQLDWGTIKGIENFSSWIATEVGGYLAPNIKKVIYEDFVLYPWKAQSQMWSQFETVQVIGVIKHQCWLNEIEFEKVPARDKNIGFMYQGIKEPPHSNPLNHQMVAAAHGIFWLTQKGIRPHKER